MPDTTELFPLQCHWDRTRGRRTTLIVFVNRAVILGSRFQRTPFKASSGVVNEDTRMFSR